MPEIGGNNPFPLELGGGKSTTEQIYSLLKDAAGIGGAGDDDTLEGYWRMAQARGLRAAMSVQRAVNQNFPELATDMLVDLEELFLLSAGDLSDEERRELVADRYYRQIDASGSGIDDRLDQIDPLFEVKSLVFDGTTSTIMGRAFEDETPADPDACGPAFGGGRTATMYPNYSDSFMCTVQYAIPAGVPSSESASRIQRAKDVLNEVLPAWVDFQIYTGSTGFYLDISLLDLGSFS